MQDTRIGEKKADAKQSDTGANVELLAGPPPANNAKDALVVNDPCDNKECDAVCNATYTCGCAVGCADGVASGYANGYSDGYYHATTLVSDNKTNKTDNNWDNSDNWDSDNRSHDEKCQVDCYDVAPPPPKYCTAR